MKRLVLTLMYEMCLDDIMYIFSWLLLLLLEEILEHVIIYLCVLSDGLIKHPLILQAIAGQSLLVGLRLRNQSGGRYQRNLPA